MEDMNGKTIAHVESFESSQGGVHSLIFHFTDGSSVEISPSSYNYGQQELYVEHR